MNFALIFFGIWAIAAPFFTGNTGTEIFFNNIILGCAMILTAAWNLLGCSKKKI